jgi:NADH-quinone oxidoreductase subunit D
VPVGTGERSTLGDCFDRYMVRIRENQESCRLLRQCLDRMPEGPALGKVAASKFPAAGAPTCESRPRAATSGRSVTELGAPRLARAKTAR